MCGRASGLALVYELLAFSSQDIMSRRRRASHLHIIACLVLSAMWLNRWVFVLLTHISTGEARAYTKLMNMLSPIARKLHWLSQRPHTLTAEYIHKLMNIQNVWLGRTAR